MKTSRYLIALLALLGAAAALPAVAAGNTGADATAAAQAQTPLTEGEIRKVDAAAGKLTIRHGPIVNLDMSAMTMIFRVRDPAMIGRVKEGDRVRFTVERVDGALTVTALEVAPAQ
ncbi:copper-binding protein [Cupriavidus basilensis]|uniref:copper-binding protein n=1 Tax=Cupriavidus basilensis TaxID=68895 RepID=UPI000750AFC4|nr:copper-binding protein [Cupriavidus basilensis]